MVHITVDECRTILGADAIGRTDEDIERLRCALEAAAVVMYDEVVRVAQTNPEALRWASYAYENPEDAYGSDGLDEEFDIGAPNLLDFTEEELATDGEDLESIPEVFKCPRP